MASSDELAGSAAPQRTLALELPAPVVAVFRTYDETYKLEYDEAYKAEIAERQE